MSAAAVLLRTEQELDTHHLAGALQDLAAVLPPCAQRLALALLRVGPSRNADDVATWTWPRPGVQGGYSMRLLGAWAGYDDAAGDVRRTARRARAVLEALGMVAVTRRPWEVSSYTLRPRRWVELGQLARCGRWAELADVVRSTVSGLAQEGTLGLRHLLDQVAERIGRRLGDVVSFAAGTAPPQPRGEAPAGPGDGSAPGRPVTASHADLVEPVTVPAWVQLWCTAKRAPAATLWPVAAQVHEILEPGIVPGPGLGRLVLGMVRDRGAEPALLAEVADLKAALVAGVPALDELGKRVRARGWAAALRTPDWERAVRLARRGLSPEPTPAPVAPATGPASAPPAALGKMQAQLDVSAAWIHLAEHERAGWRRQAEAWLRDRLPAGHMAWQVYGPSFVGEVAAWLAFGEDPAEGLGLAQLGPLS